jgi:hypothetical protein
LLSSSCLQNNISFFGLCSGQSFSSPAAKAALENIHSAILFFQRLLPAFDFFDKSVVPTVIDANIAR